MADARKLYIHILGASERNASTTPGLGVSHSQVMLECTKEIDKLNDQVRRLDH